MISLKPGQVMDRATVRKLHEMYLAQRRAQRRAKQGAKPGAARDSKPGGKAQQPLQSPARSPARAPQSRTERLAELGGKFLDPNDEAASFAAAFQLTETLFQCSELEYVSL